MEAKTQKILKISAISLIVIALLIWLYIKVIRPKFLLDKLGTDDGLPGTGPGNTPAPSPGRSGNTVNLNPTLVDIRTQSQILQDEQNQAAQTAAAIHAAALADAPAKMTATMKKLGYTPTVTGTVIRWESTKTPDFPEGIVKEKLKNKWGPICPQNNASLNTQCVMNAINSYNWNVMAYDEADKENVLRNLSLIENYWTPGFLATL